MYIAYLDNSSTTKPCETAVKCVNDAVTANWGNPSSLHKLGISAETVLSDTRKSAAALLSCKENEVYFTSGGTESNNIALSGAAHALKRRGNRIVTTSVEHPSVLETCRALQKEGFEVVYVKPENDGCISAEKIAAAVNKDTVLISVMLVNNETGAIFPVEKLRGIANSAGAPALIHCDAVQAFGKIPTSVKKLDVDLLSASAHKIHGIKGCGLLYKSEKAHILPLTYGGHQESGLRSGTESVPAIAGFYGALKELDINNSLKRVRALNDCARAKLSKIDGVIFNSPSGALSYILNISLPGYRSETVLHFLESKGIFVSSGSACAKGKSSYVLSEMGLGNSETDSAIRLSFSRYNTENDIDRLCAALTEAKKSLRSSDRHSKLDKLRR